MTPKKFAAIIVALFATLWALPAYAQSERGARLQSGTTAPIQLGARIVF